MVHAIYGRSGIETRHSVVRDFFPDAAAELYYTAADDTLISPGTEERNRLYAREARKLAVGTAQRALDGCKAFSATDVTHVIFVSCTGFANPGPDYHLVRDLGLRGQTQRYVLGFMGCYASFPALRLAQQICQADPQAVVLLVSVELCTLHMQISSQPDTILANALFSDGAAAALVSARPPQGGALVLEAFHTALVPSGAGDMAWEIGNEGFNIVLSSYVPEIIGANLPALLANSLGSTLEQIRHWAVHPGGRAILEKVTQALHLDAGALEASYSVLRDFGNMSSATIFFVLEKMLGNPEIVSQEPICALAFGPGLTVETALLHFQSAP
jgi:predicted naringenin-chalcone synthase